MNKIRTLDKFTPKIVTKIDCIFPLIWTYRIVHVIRPHLHNKILHLVHVYFVYFTPTMASPPSFIIFRSNRNFIEKSWLFRQIRVFVTFTFSESFLLKCPLAQHTEIPNAFKLECSVFARAEVKRKDSYFFVPFRSTITQIFTMKTLRVFVWAMNGCISQWRSACGCC